jgi:hypothetical protein
MDNLLGLAEVEQCDAHICSVAHLEIWKPSVVVFDVGGSVGRWWLDHLFSELPNCIHDLLEIARYCFIGLPPRDVNHSESLDISKNMKKHCHLLFDKAVDVIFKQPLTLNVFNMLLKGVLFILDIWINSTSLLL